MDAETAKHGYHIPEIEHVELTLRFGFQYPLDSQSEGGGTVTVHSRSSRGGRVPVKVIAQWKEGIEVGIWSRPVMLSDEHVNI